MLNFLIRIDVPWLGKRMLCSPEMHRSIWQKGLISLTYFLMFQKKREEERGRERLRKNDKINEAKCKQLLIQIKDIFLQLFGRSEIKSI